MQKHNREVLFNLIFWLFYFLYEWLGLAALSGDYKSYFINACMALPLAFIISYFTVHVFVKNYYNKGEKLKFWTMQIGVAVLLLLLRRMVNYYLIYPTYFPWVQKVALFSFGKLIIEVVNLYLIVGVYSLFYFVQSWYIERQRVQSLLQEKTAAELELLKSQVQPHFIFNTLNTIYSTAVKTSPETASLVSHLSSFLDYNLYTAKQNLVPLQFEVDYLEHYLQLQKSRYGNKLDVSINIYHEIVDLHIAPLLLLPLVENSIKHGVASSIVPGWIRIDVSRAAQYFSIKIENSIEEKPGFMEHKNGGIGIANVKKRLELIYPGVYEFKVVKQPHCYLALLKLKFSK